MRATAEAITDGIISGIIATGWQDYHEGINRACMFTPKGRKWYYFGRSAACEADCSSQGWLSMSLTRPFERRPPLGGRGTTVVTPNPFTEE